MLCSHVVRLMAIFCLAAVLFTGCGIQSPSHSPPPQIAQVPPVVPVPDGPVAPVERKIIYTSQIELLVGDLTATQQRLTEMIKSIQSTGGYLAKQEVIGQQGSYRHGSWVIRVPLARFDGFVSELEGLGELKRNSRDAQDVTEAYADLEARLRNQQASETRLLSHLQKTAELKDTLEVEREITRVRGEIERLQGQLNLLKNKTDLATITLTLIERETYAPVAAPTFSTEISKTFQSSIDGLVLVAKTATVMIVALTPWVIAAGLIALPILLVRRLLLRLVGR